MGHQICAMVVAGPTDRALAESLDLRALGTHGDLTVFPIDHYYSAYWAARRGSRDVLDVPDGLVATFPREAVLRDIAGEVTGHAEPRFAIVQTEYFGGVGEQWAVAFHGQRRLTGEQTSINAALAALGVTRSSTMDEFDTVELSAFRHNPEYLDRYVDLCAEHGL